MEDDNLLFRHGVKQRVPESTNIYTPNARDFRLLRRKGMIEKPCNGSIDEVCKCGRAGRVVSQEIRDSRLNFMKRRVGIASLHAPALRARRKTAATASSLAKRRSR